MILVTGGAGFIGSNLLAGLEQRGDPPAAVCDRLGAGDKWRNLAKRELADLIAPELLFEWLAVHGGEIDLVVHLGAVSATTTRDVDAIVAANIRLSLDLWGWCAETGTRLIYAGSAASYGNGAGGFDDDMSADALARLRPLNPYGWSKLLVDRRIARLASGGAARPPQWVGLRFFNVYGPNEYHKGGQRSVAVQNFEQVQAEGKCRLFRSHHPDYPDGGQRRDFVWVDDCVEVMLWLIDNPGVSGLFNLGTGRSRAFAELAGAVFAALGREAQIDYIDTPPEIRDRYQYLTEARMERLRAAGYERPFTPLEDGVGAYVRDYLATDDPYR